MLGKWHLEAKERGLEQSLPLCSSDEKNPAYTLILDFWPPELWGSTFLLCKPLSLRLSYGNPSELPQASTCEVSSLSSHQTSLHSILSESWALSSQPSAGQDVSPWVESLDMAP